MQRYTADYYYKWLHCLQDFSIILLHDFLWLGVYFFLEMYITDRCQIWFGIFWIAAMHAVVFLVRHFCHKLPLLLIGHGVLYGIVILLAWGTNYLKEAETIFSLLMLTGCLIESIQQWRSEFAPSVYYLRWYFFPEPFILYFYGLYVHVRLYRTVAVVLAIIFLIGHFWCVYLQGMNDYLDQHMDAEKIPRSSILRMNTKVIVWLLLGFSAVFISFAAFRFDVGFLSIGNFLAAFFRFFLSGLQGLIHSVRWWNHSGVDNLDDSMEQALQPTEAPSVVGDAGNDIYMVLGVVISLIIFFYMVYRLAHAFDDRDNRKWIPPEFGSHLRTDDQVEDLRKKERKLFHLFRTNREKIRYQFKKRVKKSMKGSIPKSYTAWDFNNEIQKKQADENMTVLTDLYDVARYGEREITSAEVKRCIKRF